MALAVEAEAARAAAAAAWPFTAARAAARELAAQKDERAAKVRRGATRGHPPLRDGSRV